MSFEVGWNKDIDWFRIKAQQSPRGIAYNAL